MARPPSRGRSARVEFRAKPEHKALWESLVDRDDLEDFTDWLIDAANERACRMLERREPGYWAAKGFTIRRPSGPLPAVSREAAPVLPPMARPPKPKLLKPMPRRRRKR